MSRAATATPPAPYFPQRVSTPTMRHSSSPNVTSAHFNKSHNHNLHQAKKRAKHITPKPTKPEVGLKTPTRETHNQAALNDALGLSFEEIPKPYHGEPRSLPVSRTHSIASLATMESYSTSRTNDTEDSESMRLTPTPPFSFASDTVSLVNTPLATPASSVSSLPSQMDSEPSIVLPPILDSPNSSQSSSAGSRVSWVPSFGKMAKAVVHTGKSISMPFGDRKKKEMIVSPSTPTKESLVNRLPTQITTTAGTEIVTVKPTDVATARSSLPSQADLARLTEEEAAKRKREWADAERTRIFECARLCSQWPQSGYNQAKFGPNGSRCYYEPQSYANPQYVASVMAKQTALEQVMSESSSFFSCQDHQARVVRDGLSSHSGSGVSVSTADSIIQPKSIVSTPSSNSLCPAMEIDHDRTEADIKAAMLDHIIPLPTLQKVEIEKVIKGARSISELNALASSMILSKDESSMDIDSDQIETASIAATSDSAGTETDRSVSDLQQFPLNLDTGIRDQSDSRQISLQSSTLRPPTRPHRAQSCGSKRPLVIVDTDETMEMEEEKRRRVDEAMVVEEAVSTGVIMPQSQVINLSNGVNNSSKQSRARMINRNMSSSAPDLSAVNTNVCAQAQCQIQPGSGFSSEAGNGAVFGHVVKTSDTHPIIISPFFPTELLSLLTQHLINPALERQSRPIPQSTDQTLFLSSAIDVPSLLLSHQVQPTPNVVVPSPTSSTFLKPLQTDHHHHHQPRTTVGNLLLSSCPGKRLRMDGPVKGRGPVCRDLTTDLRRIRGEGVGCLVCCLDDTELSLLGVPWETYREVAAESGLDIIRLPMPDGFTPVSLCQFDSQINLIVKEYTLKGIDVLVHCRGGVGRAGLTACAWAIKMGYVAPHPSLALIEEAAYAKYASKRVPPQAQSPNKSYPPTQNIDIANKSIIPAELEHQIVMSIVERVIAMIRSRRGLKAIESFEQVQFLVSYTGWLRRVSREV